MSTYPLGITAWVDVDDVSSYKAIKSGGGWLVSALCEEVADGRVSRIRPLVELDINALPIRPKSSTLSVLRQWQRTAGREGQRVDANVLGAIADQIEAQAWAPRIPEPGQFGVVEAAADKSPGRHKWVRQGDLWWNGSAWNVWDSLIDPTLIREGVES